MSGRFAIAGELAGRQHGRVTWRQLVAAGVDRHTIQRWLRDGRLRPLHRGVYAVGHLARSVQADYMAAVLACGDGAVLSHGPAAHLLRLTRGSAPPPEVTVTTGAGRGRRGIVVHRVAALDARDVTSFSGIAIAGVPRALLDIAPGLGPAELSRACHEAWIHHGTTPADIERCIARNPHRPAIAKLRRAAGSDVTLSALEGGFLKLLAEHRLPRPRTNLIRAGDRVDCHWPQLGLTVELLSFRYHGTRHAFERDVARRRRSNHLAYSYGDVFERGAATAAELRGHLT